MEKWLDELLEQARKEGQGKAKEGTDSGGQVRTVQYSKEDRAGHGQRRDRYSYDTNFTGLHNEINGARISSISRTKCCLKPGILQV